MTSSQRFPTSVVVCLLVGVLSSPAAQADVLLTCDFEQATATGNAELSGPTTIADYDRMGSCMEPFQVRIVGAPAVRQGKRAVRVLLRDDLPSSSPGDIRRGKERCELNTNTFQSSLAGWYGKTRWYAWSILIPRDGQFDPDDTYPAVTHWMTHAQILHNDGADRVGHASFHLLPTPAGRWEATIRGGPTPWAPVTRHHKFGALTRGVWHDFLMEFRFHSEDGKALTRILYRVKGGAFEEAVNDPSGNVPLASLAPEEHVYYFKTGIYRGNEQNGAHVIYADGAWIGETRADVMPFFSDTPAAALAAPRQLQLR